MHWDHCFPRRSKDWPSSHCQHKWEWNSVSAFPQTYNETEVEAMKNSKHQHLLIIFLKHTNYSLLSKRGDNYQPASSKPQVKELTSSRGRSRSTFPLCKDGGVKSAELCPAVFPQQEQSAPQKYVDQWGNKDFQLPAQENADTAGRHPDQVLSTKIVSWTDQESHSPSITLS